MKAAPVVATTTLGPVRADLKLFHNIGRLGVPVYTHQSNRWNNGSKSHIVGATMHSTCVPLYDLNEKSGGQPRVT